MIELEIAFSPSTTRNVTTQRDSVLLQTCSSIQCDDRPVGAMR